jgi:hypothetical protein
VAFQSAANQNVAAKIFAIPFKNFKPAVLKTHCRHTLKQFKTLASATEHKTFTSHINDCFIGIRHNIASHKRLLINASTDYEAQAFVGNT